MSEQIASIPHESALNVSQLTEKPRTIIQHRFTSEEARAARLRQAEIARRNAAIASGELQIQPTHELQDGYVQRETFTRIREHIEKTDKALDDAKSALERKHLSSSLKELQDQERILAGRPLPGALRPNSKRQSAPPTEPI